MDQSDGNAIVYAEGAFNTPNGKTAHGLVRFTRRYRVLAVIDSRYAGRDSGQVLDRKNNSIPVVSSVRAAVNLAESSSANATHLVVGLAPDGGRLDHAAREDIKEAIRSGLNIDSGLHDYLSEDPDIADLARQCQVQLRDVRKPPPSSQLHFFSGKIEQVDSLKVALLGTDSAVGKRTTAWKLVHGLQDRGYRAELVGTGQTAWMQGVRYGLVLDSLVNDFVTGEIEHAVWSCWSEVKPEVIVIEGQGSLMNPAYPGGFEILASGRPDIVVLQHAPSRQAYDGFPDYPLHPLPRQIQAIEIVSGKPVVAVTVSHEGLNHEEIPRVCRQITEEIGLPAFDVLLDGPDSLVEVVEKSLKQKTGPHQRRWGPG